MRLAAGLTLLLLAACGGAPPPPEAGPDADARVFRDEADAVGLGFVHVNGMTGAKYFVEMAGAGAALLDYDGDGDLDAYLVQGHALDGAEDPGARDRLFRNELAETGRLAFTDVTAEAGIAATGYGMGVATGDYDRDGDPDLYVTNWGPNQLWRNDGDGTFTDATTDGLDDPRWSTSAAFVDYDRDGWLDLYVVNYVAYRLENDHPCFATRSGRRDYCGPQSYAPEPDRLLRNRGDGTFEDVTVPMGLARAAGAGLGVVVLDADEDGWPDLYVANDGMENGLWMNRQGQRFEDEAARRGAAVSLQGAPQASMGLVAEDFDGDGDDDLFMTHLNGEANTYYENLGQGLFEDRSRRIGLGPPSWPFTAFGIAALDYDLDGRLDLFIANGEVRIIPEQADAGEPLPLRQPDQLFRNTGGAFEEVNGWAGAHTDRAEVGRGVAVGDVDNDGDPDVLLVNNNGPARLLRNEVGQQAHGLGLMPVDAEGRPAVGARAALVRADGTALWRRSHTDGSYGSAHDPRIVFGLGDDPAYARVRVRWPDGTEEAWVGLAPGAYHTVVQGQGQPLAP
ncbi:MAG: CRTAC1 family protein [Rhodothermales bacterium]|nr:CRTAC1 family protein [Rhodothermales bacterium]